MNRWVWVSKEARGHQTPGPGVTGGCGCEKPFLGPLQEQYIFITVELSLQSFSFRFLWDRFTKLSRLALTHSWLRFPLSLRSSYSDSRVAGIIGVQPSGLVGISHRWTNCSAFNFTNNDSLLELNLCESGFHSLACGSSLPFNSGIELRWSGLGASAQLLNHVEGPQQISTQYKTKCAFDFR